MADLVGLIIQLSPPLVGSLIGVIAGFRLDRRAENRQKKEELLERLKSINRELDKNRDIAQGNYNVIAELQEKDIRADHYTLSLFETSAWETAIGNQLVEELDTDLYSNLYDVYSESKSINEQVRRLRTEAIHPSIGETEEDNPFDVQVWTISVKYWNSEEGEVETTGLGELIKGRSKTLRLNIDDIQPDLKDQIRKLEDEIKGKADRRQNGGSTTETDEVPMYFPHY